MPARRSPLGDLAAPTDATARAPTRRRAESRRARRQLRRVPEIARGARPDVAAPRPPRAPPRPASAPGPAGGGRPRHPERRPSRRCSSGRGADSLDEVAWTAADAALVDEARAVLGPWRPRPARSRAEARERAERAGRRSRSGRPGSTPRREPAPATPVSTDEVRSFGHIVVDEAQDLSPMQLRMLARRSLSGSMTVVGDIAQATGAVDAAAAGTRWPTHLTPAATAPPGRADRQLPDAGRGGRGGGAGPARWPRPSSTRRGRSGGPGSPPRDRGRASAGRCSPTGWPRWPPSSWPRSAPGRVAVLAPGVLLAELERALSERGLRLRSTPGTRPGRGWPRPLVAPAGRRGQRARVRRRGRRRAGADRRRARARRERPPVPDDPRACGRSTWR